MRSTRKARGVVMFVDEDHLRRILAKLDQMIQEDPTLDNYFWCLFSCFIMSNRKFYLSVRSQVAMLALFHFFFSVRLRSF